MKFPNVSPYSFLLYHSGDAIKLGFLALLSQNMWEGFAAFQGQTSGHIVRVYDGPYSPI
jgi:hypothetical protein